MSNFDFLMTPSALMKPDRVVEPLWWAGHIPFVMWLVENIKPKVLVELGAHTGNSYFSMCHSVKVNGLATRCYAVDTWQGDPHQGAYDDEVYHSVRQHNDHKYSEFSALLRMTFDDALSMFSDGTIDLLHIDGFHTYDAVRHDFETWLPKLSDRAIVIFHDTTVRKLDFGVWRFWDELSGKYPHVHFNHSQGLGVLFVGKKQPLIARDLLSHWENDSAWGVVHQFFTRLGQSIEFESRVTSLNQSVLERDGLISNLNQSVLERDGLIGNLNQSVLERDGLISNLNQSVLERDRHINSLCNSIADIQTSTSWRITMPLRFVSSTIRKVFSVLSVLPEILEKSGGFWPACKKTIRVIRTEGLLGLKLRLRRFFLNKALNATLVPENEFKLPIVPYYITPKLESTAVTCNGDVSIAVHIHLHDTDMLNAIASYLNNIPIQFDLYVSVPKASDLKRINAEFNLMIRMVRRVVVEHMPDSGSNEAPMIIQFGQRLQQYEIIAHINTSQYDANLTDILSKLLGASNDDGEHVAHIIGLLQTSAKVVFPEDPTAEVKNRRGWGVNFELAKDVLEKYAQLSINDFAEDEFPERMMFWARGECLKDFFALPLISMDFPLDSIVADGTLERLALIFASQHKGQYIRIQTNDSIQDFRHYEKQQDYTSFIIHSDVKVLSYYLPQFHPIPENDVWHGKGFTEWTKVKAANPLFEGHYQQHIPHSDIGYYLLDSADTLRVQAEMMQKSGVYGQVFYHYWFTGKLILEEPAQILLDNPDVHMPFCFCWANENWTRRWDGNENEILLGQDYSAQDAQDFIRYLVPFFKDSRYIKIEGRPVIFIYRPASIPNSQEYLNIWEKECAEVGISRPYVVAVLTRGAKNPNDFGMDAGVERVLHDWTDGAVPEIKNTLRQYWPINGSVLPYDKVANFYMGQNDAKNFTYFRSTVPVWDNTARYGSEAYLLHGSTPQSFQAWMESSIAFTKETLPSDRRFLLVNAWNEWAEGAHLEPDSRYGYSYLNSVGRALSGIPYSAGLNLESPIPAGTKLHLQLQENLVAQLRKDITLKQRFVHCLSQACIINNCLVSIDALDLAIDVPETLNVEVGDGTDADFTLEIRQLTLFDATVIDKMLQTACTSGALVIANSYGDDSPLIEVTENGSVLGFCDSTPLLLVPRGLEKFGHKNVRMRTDARCFMSSISPQVPIKKHVVTTIIRFHQSGCFKELQNALYSLYAMRGCIVIPLIAAQDLNDTQIEKLKSTLKGFVWEDGCEPQVYYYQSKGGTGDLRSTMLNESLKKVTTRYAAFLDFDDLLMPHAYDWLISRLEKTGKAVSFGRVYATSSDSKKSLLLKRSRSYEYGYSYEEFVLHNHAPLHSFMLDIGQFDLNHITYFEDQRFMEDYLLSLQLFTKENCDWESLKENFYIGDYIHNVDREHTLAFSCEKERQAIIANPEYAICEQRISDMRKCCLLND